MVNQVAGVSGLTVDGIAFDVTKIDWKYSGIKQEMLTSMTSIDGTKSFTYTIGEITATMRFNPSMPPDVFGGLQNVTVVIALRNGDTVNARNCIVTEPPNSDPTENTFDVVFQSSEIIRVGGN